MIKLYLMAVAIHFSGFMDLPLYFQTSVIT